MKNCNRKTDRRKSDLAFAGSFYSQHPSLRKLTPLEKKFLLSVEHGDATAVKKLLALVEKDSKLLLDVNCKDPVGRSATLMAIDNENLEMLTILLENGVESRDALLHAINAEYVEAVELLLDHEDIVHKEGEIRSWEKVDRDIASFTPEITPLILAAHKDNYEILKILLDRGATLPMPHDVCCRCNECVRAINEDCLCHSRSRINAYRALSSPSLICLSSIDPILTAFELSWELRRLSIAENEFKEDYQKLRFRCQDFATALLAQTRSSEELSVVLNHDVTTTGDRGKTSTVLSRIDMALKYKQKKFIAHPNVQQLLSTLWYDGLPGVRRLNSVQQLWEIIKIGVLFPLYAVIYMIFPNSSKGKLIRKAFFKFILHSFSYLFFLFLLILASVRVETVLVQIFGTEKMNIELMESLKKQRGQPPTLIETSILLFIIAHVWQETRELWKKGVVQYVHNMWNIIDFTRNLLHVGTACMRVLAYIQAQTEIQENPMFVYVPREAWEAFDPMLIADGLFAAGNVFAALKLVHIFSINPYLGPLQISLGRMVIDIIKFFSIYTLVLFAFACGLNQLLWYYADREKVICFTGPGGTENWVQQRDACLAWRRFSNLFESSQTLFWASFGLVDISNFELSGIKGYTRFWGLLMFGSYSVINVVVLLNLLIAMMSNSYQIISERSDEEWKFARTRLFMNYFEEGGTLPPPFNILPSIKNVLRLCRKGYSSKKIPIGNEKNLEIEDRDAAYENVMCNLVWRYVTAQQKACESDPVTEDHVKELRQDVSSFRHDLMHVLSCNGMNTKEINLDKVDVPPGKKVQIRERRLLKNFTIGLMEVCAEDAAPEIPANKSVLARLVSGTETGGSQRWTDLIQLVKRRNIGNKNSTFSVVAGEEQNSAPLSAVKVDTNGNMKSESTLNLPSPIQPTHVVVLSTEKQKEDNKVFVTKAQTQRSPMEEVQLSPNALLKTELLREMKCKRQSPAVPKKTVDLPKSMDTSGDLNTLLAGPSQANKDASKRCKSTAPPIPGNQPITERSIETNEATVTITEKSVDTAILVPSSPSKKLTDINWTTEDNLEENRSVTINLTADSVVRGKADQERVAGTNAVTKKIVSGSNESRQLLQEPREAFTISGQIIEDHQTHLPSSGHVGKKDENSSQGWI